MHAAIALVAGASAAIAAPRKDAARKEPPPAPAAKAPASAPDIKPPDPVPVASPPPKAGDRRRIVGILDVKVEGVPAESAAQFQSNLEAQLDIQHFWLAPRARMHDLMANSTRWTEGCVIGQCLAEVKTQTGADLVLLAALTGSGTSFGYVVTLVRTDTGRVLSQQSERCDVCTVNEALSNATKATVKLLEAVPDKLPDEDAEHRAALAAATGKLETRLAEDRHSRKVLGITLTVAGLAAAAAGVAVYAAKDHTVGGLAAGAGAGLALSGVVVLTF